MSIFRRRLMSINNLESIYAYGIEWDVNDSSPKVTRVGNKNLHRTLPVQSQIKGCLLSDTGVVNKYLDPTDWTKETRDGSAGQVMVELPKHYRKCVTSGTKRRVLLSMFPLTGYTEIPKAYVSAYQATVQHSTGKLCSVVNTSTDYRGGDNNSSYDSDSGKTLLGRPASNISTIGFRVDARKRGNGSHWNMMVYNIQKEIYWLFAVEYATRNSQDSVASSLDGNGYHQGGLGPGVTNLDWSRWNSFNGSRPFIPCGYTDSLGNRTGQISFTMPSSYGSLTTYPNRYRGIELPFGHIWEWTDGINIEYQSDAAGGLAKAYVCSDPSKFNSTGYDGYTYVGNISRGNGWTTDIIFGSDGEILTSKLGGSGDTYYCDGTGSSIPSSGTVLRAVGFGGYARDGSSAGLVFLNSAYAPSDASSNCGSRLCFIP